MDLNQRNHILVLAIISNVANFAAWRLCVMFAFLLLLLV